MVFKPSCVGSVTEHCYGVRNTSRLPLHFEWKLHNQDNNLTVSPLAGVILPNDTQVRKLFLILIWLFLVGKFFFALLQRIVVLFLISALTI